MKPEDLQPIPKQRYYDQQLLQVADFKREQDYHLGYRNLQTRLLFTPGIVLGMNVEQGATEGLVNIQPGLAIDDTGQQILLVSGAKFHADVPLKNGLFTLDLTDKQFQDKKWLLTIEYSFKTDPNDLAQTNEFPQLTLIDTASGQASDTQIALATLDIKTTGTGTNIKVQIDIDLSVRVQSSLIGGQAQNISADQITSGTLNVERIPDLDAGKITSGKFDADRIPDVPFSKITGKLDADNISDLSADKITTGKFNIAQIPDIPAANLTGSLEDTQIPALKTDQITSGIFVIDRIPDVPASKITGKLSISQLPDAPPDDSFSIEVDKPNVNGEETVTLTWKGASDEEVHLEYIYEDKLVEEIWKPVSAVAKGWKLTPYETTVCTLTAYKEDKVQARQQFIIQVVPNQFQYLKSLYYPGVSLSDALQFCVNRYNLLPLTRESMQSLADAASRAGYSEDEALKILKTYPQKISELTTPVITDFSNDKNNFNVSWNPVPDADGYELQFAFDAGQILQKADGKATQSTFTLKSAPAPGNYAIHMRAVAGGVDSQWSDVESLNIPEPKASQHHWAFDESDGPVALDAMGKVNGTLTPSVRRESPGCIGSGAVHIDGSDSSFVTFGTKIGQFKSDDFTVALWLKTTETYRYFDIVGNRTDGSHGNFFCLRMTGQHESGNWGMLVAEVDQDGNGTNYLATQSSHRNLNDGNWHHAAVVRSGQSLKIYVDGVLSAEASAGGVANISNGNDFKLGRSLVGVSDKFAPDASYDEFWAYDSALSSDEILNLFKAKENQHPGGGGSGIQLYFNGQTYGEVQYNDPAYYTSPNPAALPNTLFNLINDGFTIEATVFLTNEGEMLPIISADMEGWSNYKPDEPSLCLSIDSGNPSFLMTTYTWNAGVPSSPMRKVLTADKKLSLYEWTHIAVTHDYNGSVILYINGQAATNTWFNTSMPGFKHYLLGKFENNFFSGYMKEVRIWKGARTAEQILQYSAMMLGSQAATFIPQGLGAYWQLQDTEGNVAKDGIDKNNLPLYNPNWMPLLMP